LMLSTQQSFDQAVSKQVTLLDETVETPADGHLRRVSTFLVAIRGRL
jgi:hypothetical protein